VQEEKGSAEQLAALVAAIRGSGTDESMAKRLAEAASRDEFLRYVAEVDAEAGTVKTRLRSFPRTSGIGSLRGTEIRVAFHTVRHGNDQPIAVRGPGAGPLVIASSMFNDVIRLSRQLGS